MGKFNAVVYSLKKFAVGVYATLQLALPIKSFAGDVSLSGRVVNDQGVGQANKNVVLFLNNNEKKLNGVTGADGVYVIPFTPSGVRHEHFLPEGYSVSNNYPNPFNPSTNVNITLPERSRVEMKVYDMLAQELGTVVDGEYDAGVHGVNVDLEDLVSSPSQGVYILKTVINDAYANAKKILFLRDSQHAGSFNFGGVSSNNYFSKVSLQDVVDSMHVNGRSILPTSKSLGVIISGDTDLGDVVVDSAFNVDGKVISTIRYDQPNNHLPNLTVIIDGYSAVSDSLGNFSVQVPVDSVVPPPFSGLSPWHRKMDIVDPSIWTRKKHLYVRGDASNVIEDVLTREDFPDSVMNFMNELSWRDKGGLYDVIMRFVDKPIFYIVADTTQDFGKNFYNLLSTFVRGTLNDLTKSKKYPLGFLENVVIETGVNPPADDTPSYYVIKTSMDYGNASALTGSFSIHPDGQPYTPVYAKTTFGVYPEPRLDIIKKLLAHEILSGLVFMPTRSNDLFSVYNTGPSGKIFDTDRLMWKYIFSRDNGVDYPDLDWSRSPKNPWIDNP